MDFDAEKFLRLESNAFSQEKEVERLMKLKNSQDPFIILDLGEDLYVKGIVTEKEIKQQFRQRSILVHPDKCKHPDAPEAFEILKKAEQQCMNPAKRALIFKLIEEARDQVFHENKIKKPEKQVFIFSDEAPKELDYDDLKKKHPDIAKKIKMQLFRNMADKFRRDSIRLKNEKERPMHQELKEVQETKIKKSTDQRWMETIDGRIESWKKFTDAGVKKKKRKEKPLGGIPI